MLWKAITVQLAHAERSGRFIVVLSNFRTEIKIVGVGRMRKTKVEYDVISYIIYWHLGTIK